MASRRLSDRDIDGIELPAKERGKLDVAVDPKTPGLYISTTWRGTKSWIVRYRFGGKTRKYTVGRYPAISIKEAQMRFRALTVQREGGVDPQSEKAVAREAAGADLFPYWAERYVNDELRNRNKNRTWKDQAALLGLRLAKLQRKDLPHLKGEPLRWEIIKGRPADLWRKRNVASIAKREIAELLDVIAEERGPAAARATLRNLNPMFAWLRARGVLNALPTEDVIPPAASASDGDAAGDEDKGAKPLSERQLRLLWLAADEVGPPWRDFVKLLILTGARRSEVAGIRLSELDIGFWTRWELPKARAKNKRDHVIPLSPPAQEIVQSLFAEAAERESGLLLTTTGRTPISAFGKAKEHLHTAMQRLAGSRTLAPWSFHSVRKSVATGIADLRDPHNAERALVAPHVVALILNHVTGSASIPGVTRRYLKSDFFEDKKLALDAWAAHALKLVR